MTTHIALFEPHAANDQLWAAFNETRRAIAREFWPDEPILDDAETRREIVTTNPLVEFRRWMAMEGNEVAGWVRAAFRRPGTPNEKDYARFLWAGGGVRASSRRRGVGTLLLREVHSLMHALDKSVLTMTAQTEPGHAFIRRLGAVEKHSTVEQRAVFGDLDWVRLRRWEAGPKSPARFFAQCEAGHSLKAVECAIRGKPAPKTVAGFNWQWESRMAQDTVNHQEIVKKLLDSKAVDFAAIGKAVAEIGPSLAFADEPWEGFCGTMRRFVVLYRVSNPGTPVEQLPGLNAAAAELG